MTDCCRQSYGNSSFDSMNNIKQIVDNNLDTEIAEFGDDKYNFEEEMSDPREIGGNRNLTINSANIEPKEENKFGTNIFATGIWKTKTRGRKILTDVEIPKGHRNQEKSGTNGEKNKEA